MANSVNAGFAKCFITFMSIIVLLQGAGYLGLSIWGLTREHCSNNLVIVKEEPLKFAMDLIYFHDESCGNLRLEDPNIQQSIEVPIDWSKSDVITDRTYIFMIVYAVVSSIWILTSLAVLFSVCATLNTCILCSCYWPWFSAVMAGSILDVVATVYFVIDITHTTTADDTFAYVGVETTNETIMNFIREFSPFFVTPAVIMTCISCRILLIWLLNICGVSFSISIARNMAQNNAKQQAIARPLPVTHSNAPTPNMLEFNRAEAQHQQQQWLQQQQEIQQYQQEKQQQQLQQLQQQQLQQQQQQQIRPQPLPIQSVAVYAVDQERNSQSPQSASAPTPEIQYAVISKPNPEVNTTYRNTEAHPDRLNYPAEEQPTAPAVEGLSMETPLNSRYRNSDVGYQPAGQPTRVSAELRSQLPWSYTGVKFPAKPVPPPKPSHQNYPQIPEADYGTENGTPEPKSPKSSTYPQIPEPDYR